MTVTSDGAPTLDYWLDIVEAQTLESCLALGFEGTEVIAKGQAALPQHGGSLIAVTGDRYAMQLGVLATPDGHRALARTILGMEPGEDISDEDTEDAIREIVNTVAGLVKGAAVDQDAAFRLGLPSFVSQAKDVEEFSAGAGVIEMKLDATEAWVVVSVT